VGGGADWTTSVTGTLCGLFDAPPDVTVTDPEWVPGPNPEGFTPTVNEAGVVPLDGFTVIQEGDADALNVKGEDPVTPRDWDPGGGAPMT
jgi:hypothetical protein